MGDGFRERIGPAVGSTQAFRKAPHGSASRVLSHVPLFAGLPSKDLRRIAAIAEEIWFGAGKVVVEGGSPGNSFFIILDGEAKVVRTVSGRTIRLIGPGEYFGELALLDGGPRTATVIAESTLDTVRIRRAPFRELLKKEPEVGLRMMTGLASRIREYERQLVS
jgi:CRP/FNR family cyclic AMP-dependent transcriptional regulator